MMVQLAWGWLRWQPDSVLAQWYQRRFATGGSRQRRIGIVALARKLLIALWRYVDQAIVPEGARLKVTDCVSRQRSTPGARLGASPRRFAGSRTPWIDV